MNENENAPKDRGIAVCEGGKLGLRMNIAGVGETNAEGVVEVAS